MYNWYWLLVLILSIFQPILSEHIVIDGRRCCLHSSSAPIKDENAFLNRKYHVENAILPLNVERETRQNDRRYERKYGELGGENTRLLAERHVERQIFARSDRSSSRNRITEAHERRLHKTFRDVRPEPQIRTYLESHDAHSKNFRLQDRSSEPRQVLDRTLTQRIEIKNTGRNSHWGDRKSRSFRRSVSNEGIVAKKDTERSIDRTQYRISGTHRNEDEIFRNTIRSFRDNSQRRNLVTHQRVTQIEDGQEHITSSLDRSSKLFKRSTSHNDIRIPERHTNLRGEHINARRTDMGISRQRSAALNHGIRRSDVSHSRMEETRNLQFDRANTRTQLNRDNSKFAFDERDMSGQSLKRLMGVSTSRNRDDKIRNLRSEQKYVRNRERFVRENSPANNVFIQSELARQNFLREVDNKHVTGRNEYRALNVRRDNRNNERFTGNTGRTILVESNSSSQNIRAYNEQLKNMELRKNEKSDSAVCQLREMRNTCARIKTTDGTKAERYDDENNLARSVDRTMQSDTFTDQSVTKSFKRNLNIRKNDIFVKHYVRPSGVRMLTIERASRNREQQKAYMRDIDSISGISESTTKNNRALERNIHRQKLRINDGQITRSRETDRPIIRQKRTDYRNYERILRTVPALQNIRRTLVTRFVRSREQLEGNKQISNEQYSRNSDTQKTQKRNIPFRNNSRYTRIDSRENTFIKDRNVDLVHTRMQENDMIRDIHKSKINIERNVRENIRDSNNAVRHDFRQQNNRMFAYEDITNTQSDSNTNRLNYIDINKRNTLRISHETREISRNIIGNRVFHERNNRHTEQRVSLEPSVRKTDIRHTNRRINQIREEPDTNRREERKAVLNTDRKSSLSIDRFETQSQARNNHRRKIVNLENDSRRNTRVNALSRNTNRFTRNESDRSILVKREVIRRDLRNVEDRKARAKNLFEERTHLKNMENRLPREITYERNSNIKDESKSIDEEPQILLKNERMAMTKYTTRARGERHANTRLEERRQLRVRTQQREMNEFTRLKTERTPRRSNVRDVRDIENRQRSTSDVYREFRKTDMERDQSRRNIEFAYIFRTITSTKSISTDSKSTENSYFSLFCWQYLFYAIQGFYILYVFKKMLHEKETDKKTNFMGWTSQRVIKVD